MSMSSAPVLDNSSGRSWQVAFVVVSLVAGSLPLLFPYFVSQDGPNHVATGQALKSLFAGSPPGFLLAYEWLPAQITNSFCQYLLALLLSIFPSGLAERIVVAALIASMPLSALALASRFRVRSPGALFCTVPFGFSLALVIGNYNTIFSLVFSYLALAVVAKCRAWFTATDVWISGALLLLAAWAHPIGVVFALACGCAMAGTFGWMSRQQEEDGETVGRRRTWTWPAIQHRVVMPVLAAIPAVAVVLLYVLKADVGYSTGAAENPSIGYRLRNMLLLRQLYALEPSQIVIGAVVGLMICLSVAVLVYFRIRLRRISLRPEDSLLAAAVAAAVVFLVIPDGGGGSGYLIQRLDGVAPILALAWISTQDLGTRARTAWLFVALLSIGASLGTNFHALRQINAQMRPYLEVLKKIEPGSVVLSVAVSNKPLIGGEPIYPSTFFHLHHHVAAERDAVMLQNWNAHYPGFPIGFRENWDPHKVFNPYGLGEKDLCKWEQAAGVRLDYVFVWHSPEESSKSEAAAVFFGNTLANYTEVASLRTETGREAMLFQRKTGSEQRGPC